MTSEKEIYPLYELSGEEFERLCIDLLAADDPDLAISNVGLPRSIDAVGTRKTKQGSQTVAIEAKHRTTFDPKGFRSFLERLAKESQKYDEYVFITSSPIPDAQRQLHSSNAAKVLNAQFKLFGQAEVLALLNNHSAIASKYFKSVQARIKQRKIAASVATVALLISISGIGSGLYSFFGSKIEPKSQLGEQVKNVEDSIKKLNDLETSLNELKKDLQQKSEESARIAKEYEAAMKLKSLTSEQLEQVKKAVGSQSSMEIFQNYFFGFLLGVAASVIANVITDELKRRRVLTGPYA